MARRDIIVIGPSGGGIETLKDIVRDLSANLAAGREVIVKNNFKGSAEQ